MTAVPWEYAVTKVNASSQPLEGGTLEEMLSGYGNEGWELATVAQVGGAHTFFWKRPKEETKKGGPRVRGF